MATLKLTSTLEPADGRIVRSCNSSHLRSNDTVYTDTYDVEHINRFVIVTIDVTNTWIYSSLAHPKKCFQRLINGSESTKKFGWRSMMSSALRRAAARSLRYTRARRNLSAILLRSERLNDGLVFIQSDFIRNWWYMLTISILCWAFRSCNRNRVYPHCLQCRRILIAYSENDF